jgi:diguanylate cyclase (GGDEF)-like protein
LEKLEYKGRITGISLVVFIHLAWIFYGLLTREYQSVMDITFTIISFSLEAGLAYSFGKRFDIYKFLSERDFLSELYNRQYIFNIFPKLTSQLNINEKINIFIIDVNNFKSINDKYGHDKGDYVIKMISECLVKSMGDSDIIARLGGDEFLLIVPNQGVISTKAIHTKIEENLNRLSVNIGMDISISIGKSVYPDNAKTLDSLIIDADKKMYTNKSKFHITETNRLTDLETT